MAKTKKVSKKSKKAPVKKTKPKKKVGLKKVALKKPAKKVLRKKIAKKFGKKKLSKNTGIELERHQQNPIIEPRIYPWESKATFNPAAFESDGKIYIVYRAIGDDDSSVLGLAATEDGFNILERPTHFIYKRFNQYLGPDKSNEPIDYISGGGWNGGSEDPRITLIDDMLYMLYTAFDGWGSLRVALTSIKLADFKKKKWNWEKPALISPPGVLAKNWVMFPEKINGKFAIMHSFYPKILIDYFDDPKEFDGKKYIYSNNTRPVDETRTWDSWFRGVGPTPIKTKAGWLIIYHAMDHKNPDRYRMGALILDYKDPTKVLYRSKEPILEPEEHYENNGFKWGVVYSCGAVVKDGQLFVYYGGADKVIGVASIELDELLEDLKKNKVVKLRSNKMVKN
jgi:predicted GH43/DUF377 family glycosyl hydrolase